MAHLSLYRRWRPRTLSQITGQEPVVRTLRRAIETGRVAHAYLFSGPRGTGKTSTAKVLAMGMNCLHGPTPEPCGECDSCRAIVRNSSMDVIEMDAASNRGIDEVRELRDRVNLAPSGGRVRVYIIDEVHMLTTEAFNALLKMLEEPPGHVIFVLATTEAHRVLPTIISRCQRFDFRRPGVRVLTGKLREISDAEGIEIEDEALTVIARRAEGSFRDAEGLLDQLSSFAQGMITAEMVRELLGGISAETLAEAADALQQRRAADALTLIDRLAGEGRDLGQFTSELLAHLRRLMLLPYAPEVALAEVGESEREAIEQQSQRIPVSSATRMIDTLGGALNRIRRGTDTRMELELAFLSLMREPSADDASLLERVERLETMVRDGSVGGHPAPRAVEKSAGEDDEPAAQETPGEEAAQNEDAAGVAADAGGLASRWPEILRGLKERRQALTAAVFDEARVEGFDGKVLRLSFPKEKDFHIKMAGEGKHSGVLVDALEQRLGVRPRLEFSVREEGGEAGEHPVEEIRAEPVSKRTPEPAPREEGEGGSDIIQSSQEVFEIARERLGGETGNGGK